MAEYVKKYTDISNLLPVRIRDKTLTNVIRNLFNRYLTKNESASVFGYVGNRHPVLDADSVYIPEPTLERSINTLIPVVYTKHATTESTSTWADILKKIDLLGVNTDDISSWVNVKQFNFLPPINIDKFCNFKEYYWLGPWVKKSLEKLTSDWEVLPHLTTLERQSNVISFEIIDVNYTDATTNELWTISFLPNNDIRVSGSIVGIDSVTNYDRSNDNIILTGRTARIIIRMDSYRPGETITIKMTRAFNPYVKIFENLLGIDNILKVQNVFVNSNVGFEPEYYVMEKPIGQNYSDMGDWSQANLWAHKTDVLEFLRQHDYYIEFSINDISPSVRPIIEYNENIQLNSKISQSGPGDSTIGDPGDLYKQVKYKRNQVPLFDLFYRNGEHTGKISSIFYYAEGNNFQIDPEFNRRLELNNFGDFIFEQSLYDAAKDELLYYKTKDGNLKTIWSGGQLVTAEYLKADITGTIINTDKFNNYANYYWTGHLLDPSSFPEYYGEHAGSPEYTCIGPIASGGNHWQITNHWVHISQLDRSQIQKYLPAQRPIIEFNPRLVPSLVNATKTAWNEKPQFDLYEFNEVTKQYDLLTQSTTSPYKNDIIASNYVLVMNSELEDYQSQANKTIFEINTKSIFSYENRDYVQSLYNWYYVSKQYVNQTILPTIAYRSFNYIGSDVTANITNLKLLSAGGLQTWKLLYNRDESIIAGHAVFDVLGSRTGMEDLKAHHNIPYSNEKVSFLLNYNNNVVSDYFEFQFINSIKNEQRNYVKLKVDLTIPTGSPEDANNYIWKTVDSAIEITQTKNPTLVPSTVDKKDGAFKIPSVFSYNVSNENRNKVSLGDLIYHFSSIIDAQPNLIGSALSSNNFRNLPDPNLGLGGTIRQYNGQFNLFLGLMNQENITPLSLIEFAKVQYSNLQTYVTDYALNWVLDALSNGTINVSSPTWRDELFESFKQEYLIRQNSTVVESASNVDDTLAQLFYDSTSPIPNTIITLPQLGLVPLVYPKIDFDEELGIPMLTHHDGHKTRLWEYDIDMVKKYVSKSYLRSNKTWTSGVVTAKAFPSHPYKNQFWFETTSNSLYYYNVISDTGELPSENVVLDSYSYNRTSNTLFQYNGVGWVASGSISAPWIKVPNFVDELMLRVEQELFNRIPPTSSRMDTAMLEALPSYDTYLEQQFQSFGVKNNINDLYNVGFNPNDPFTWNYSSSSFAFPSWQDIYIDEYGTSRPDLFPWKIVNQSQDDFIVNVGGAPLMWTPTMWAYVKTQHPGPTSVNPDTNELLPPFVVSGNPVSSEALLTVVPPGIANRFSFGDNGVIERVWKKSIDFNYDKVKVYFRLNPIDFINQTWGYSTVTIDEFEVDRFQCKKLGQLDFKLHGERKDIVPQNGTCTAATQPGFMSDTYIVDIINRTDSYYRVTRVSDKKEFFHEIETSFSDANVSILVSEKYNRHGLAQGDRWIIELIANDVPVINFIGNPYYSYTGFNQIYIQHLRYSSSANAEISRNISLLRNYQIKLGYRFSGFIDNNLTVIKTDSFNLVDGADYQVLLKENKFISDLWMHAIRVQVVQKGSTQVRNGKQIPAKAPSDPDHLTGKDWIFKIETFNKNKCLLDFYEYSPSGESEEFTVLSQQNSTEKWLRHIRPIGTKTEYAPFLVQGIQNLVTFLFGYTQKLRSSGWITNDPVDSVVDPNTGRLLDWQLEIEYLLNYLFSGEVSAGSGYILNPFKNSVYINVPRGQVASLLDTSVFDYETSQSLINSFGMEIKPSNYRVFRENETTEIISDEPIYGVHLTISEYEHLILFNNYSSNVNLIFDPFLGQRVGRFHITGQRQVYFIGRPSFGGRFLANNKMVQNIESSVEGILNYYDTNKMMANAVETDRSRDLLGYQEKDYYQDIGFTDHSAFRFWQGMIRNKGSNFSLDAFSNNIKYVHNELDEYWAYKIAEYGNAIPISNPEIKIFTEDIKNEYTYYQFLEDVEPASNGFDMGNLDDVDNDFDVGTASMVEQGMNVDTTKVSINDEDYWYSIDDLESFRYFEAELIDEVYIFVTSLNAIYPIVNNKGEPVYSDCFEIVTPYIPASPEIPATENSEAIPAVEEVMEQTFYEYNIREEEPTPPVEEEPTSPVEEELHLTDSQYKFERLNNWTIRFHDKWFLNKLVKVKCYGRPKKSYGPVEIIDYKNKIIIRNDIILWDPAQGVHTYRAFENIDFTTKEDPAHYNQLPYMIKSHQYSPGSPWEVNQVGKIWWEHKLLKWKPYSDTKLYPLVTDRLYNWGALADYSRVNVYQWIESPVPPSEYEKYVEVHNAIPTADFTDYRPTGVPLKYIGERSRKWQHRTVAWKHSENVKKTPRKFITSEWARLILSSPEIGDREAILTSGTFAELGIEPGYKIGNAIWNTTDKLAIDPEVGIPDTKDIFGEAIVKGEPQMIAASSCSSTEDGGMFVTAGVPPDPNFDQFLLHVDRESLKNEPRTWYRNLTLTFNGSGNGSLFNFQVNPATGKAETWSFIAKNRRKFTITGSVSGSFDDAIVGVPYDNGIISFLLTEGTTMFSRNDLWLLDVVEEVVEPLFDGTNIRGHILFSTEYDITDQNHYVRATMPFYDAVDNTPYYKSIPTNKFGSIKKPGSIALTTIESTAGLQKWTIDFSSNDNYTLRRDGGDPTILNGNVTVDGGELVIDDEFTLQVTRGDFPFSSGHRFTFTIGMVEGVPALVTPIVHVITQRLSVNDIADEVGGWVSYNFTRLGLIVSAQHSFDHTMVPAAEDRKVLVANAIGNSYRNLFIRQEKNGSITDIPTTRFFADFQVLLDQSALSAYLTHIRGQIIFDREIDANGYYWISATLANDNKVSQRLLVEDTPARIGSIVSYRFDDFGITLTARQLFDHIVIPNEQDRRHRVAMDFGHTYHDLFIREKIELSVIYPFEYHFINPGPVKVVTIPNEPTFEGEGNGKLILGPPDQDNGITETWSLEAINSTKFSVNGSTSGLMDLDAQIDQSYSNGIISFTIKRGSEPYVTGDKFIIDVVAEDRTDVEEYFVTPVLYSMRDDVELAWVAWLDPQHEDLIQSFENDDQLPLNKWQPIFGPWLDIGDNLQTLAPHIEDEFQNAQTSYRQPHNRFRYYWNDWKHCEDQLFASVKYYIPRVSRNQLAFTRKEFCFANFRIPNGQDAEIDILTSSNGQRSIDVYVNQKKLFYESDWYIEPKEAYLDPPDIVDDLAIYQDGMAIVYEKGQVKYNSILVKKDGAITERADMINDWYEFYIGRPADYHGLHYWNTRLETSGETEQEVWTAFKDAAKKFEIKPNGRVEKVLTYCQSQDLLNRDSKVVIIRDEYPLKDGDLIEVMVNGYKPIQDELEFDPEKDPRNDNPLKLYQYKIIYPHSKKDEFINYGYQGAAKYYFWVKDIKSKMGNKTMSSSQISNLLIDNVEPYAIIQNLKFQFVDPEGKEPTLPNRFSVLSMKNLNTFITSSDTYKCRIIRDFSLREKDDDLRLKNVHKEWILLREKQNLVIPRNLWDKVVDSLCEENVLGEKLPSYKRQIYDKNNGTFFRYGFGKEQVLADKNIVLASVRNVIENTTLYKYINKTDYIINSIDFSKFGFDSTGTLYDISKLDLYFSSSVEIRALMEKIWVYAQPIQVNEIFFNVLNDVLSQTRDMKDLFKTSYITLQTTKVINTSDVVTNKFISSVG